MSDTPRYRCAVEHGQLPRPQSIMFAKLDGKVGIGQRAEQDDEFEFEGDPAKWMDPINQAARERVEAFVSAGRRKQVRAESSVSNEPLKAPPRSGMTRAITDASAFQIIKDVRHDENPQSNLSAARPAPKRRAPAKSA